MLRVQGTKISQKQLPKFLDFVEEVCPWFPEDGTINLEIWIKVGQRLHDHYDTHSPEKNPFSMWPLMKDRLDPRYEEENVQVMVHPLVVITEKPKLN